MTSRPPVPVPVPVPALVPVPAPVSALALALPLVAALAGGCASAVSGALGGLDDRDVDTVVTKVIARYPSVARLPSSEPFVLVLDSVIVPAPGSPWADEDARLVGATASYMLGEETGRDWVPRVRSERLVVGEGSVVLSLYPEGASGRSGEGGGASSPPAEAMRRAVLEAYGAFSLFLPVVPTGGKAGAIDALSFDVRVENQEIAIPEGDGSVDLFAEIVPRIASYGEGGQVFKRWSAALFHLGWDERRGAAGAAGPSSAGAAPGPERSLPPEGAPLPGRAIAAYLDNARPFVGPLVRLRVRLQRGEDGLARFAAAHPNAVDLVLPSALVLGDRALEGALARLSAAFPGKIERKGDDVFMRVGWFFFHGDATGPGAPDPEARRRTRDAKAFRIPPPPQPR